jgi:polysaccharide deacetylase family protein (PEP-CTERM system associated)
MLNAFTVDVEEYFHPSEVGTDLSSSRWCSLPSRVEIGTAYLLDLLAKFNVKATFFILGWVAAEHPKLVQRIAEAGHEIACHSHEHRLVYELSPSQFKADTITAVRAIGDACGIRPRTYRAPSFSITEHSLWALEILIECGFTHDSSICPIVHDRYGIPGSPRHAHTIQTPSGQIVEIPVATVELPGRRVAPIGGGGYLRIFPYRYTAAGIRRVNKVEAAPACVYVHPWEVDPDQPRLATGSIARMRTYLGLSSMATKLTRLLQDFRFSSIREVYCETVPGQTFEMAPAAAACL